MSAEFQPRPRIKTAIEGEGAVVFHDRTRYGLCRMCVAQYGKYPDLETWMSLLDSRANILSHRYTEKQEAASVFIGYLWIYYKTGR